MKKVLSVMLAAAMVMGMSVSAMATNFFAAGSSDAINETPVSEIKWTETIIINKHDIYEDTVAAGKDYKELNAGDDLYFPMNIEGEADKNWVVKVNEEEFVEDIVFVYETDADDIHEALETETAYVKVTIADDFDHYAEDGKTNFWFYVYDLEDKESSEKAVVKYSFDDYAVVNLCKADCAHKHGSDRDDAKHVAIIGSDLTVRTAKLGKTDAAKYVLCDDCFTTSQKVMFEIELDDRAVYFNAKMIPGEEYLTTVYTKFDKALTKAYDVDMFVLNIDTELKMDAVFESAKDDKVVLEVVDGELYEVESEFVTKYEVVKDKVLTKGYKVSNIDNGAFVLIDADADLDWEDTTRKEVVEAPVADDKANPSTGANDFVGAAVALAVVSVAAAGALAFKK